MNKKISALLIVIISIISILVHQSIYDILNVFTDSFSIKKIDITGATYSRNDNFDQIITENTNIIQGNLPKLNIIALKNQLEQLELIKTVDISRDLPHTLKIKVIERTPIAIVKTKNSSYKVDNSGFILLSITNILPFVLPVINVDFGIALNKNQIVDEHLVKTLSTLNSTNINLIDKISINKNRETYFTLKNITPQFYIEKLILTENFLLKAQRIGKTINSTNIQKIPKIIDIYSNKDTSIGFF